MIDLDPALTRWAGETSDDGVAAEWTESTAHGLAERLADRHGLRVSWEPGDEEWIRLLNSEPQGMLSTRLPLALLTRLLSDDLREIAPDIVIIEINDFLADELRASPQLLRATVLRDGWADDFNPKAFCANDPFVESV